MTDDKITKDEWYKYYTPQNKVLLEMIHKLRYGEVTLEIHERQIANAWFGKKYRFNHARDFKQLQNIFGK